MTEVLLPQTHFLNNKILVLILLAPILQQETTTEFYIVYLV